jgi:hypothetical protein
MKPVFEIWGYEISSISGLLGPTSIVDPDQLLVQLGLSLLRFSRHQNF